MKSMISDYLKFVVGEEQIMLNLVKPDIKHKNQYLEMLDEWKGAGEQPQPWVLQEDCSDFNAMVQKFENLSKGIDVLNGFVLSTTYWAYDDESGKILGAVNIRHYLNDMLMKVWGNIGYGIRPSERRKGYATIILKLALECCKTLKMERVLLGCYKENIASVKTILKNGGVLENEVIEENSTKIVQRYWINIKMDTKEIPLYDEIINLAKTLNKPGMLPSTGIRRNSVYYSFITYINHTIAFFISEDFDAVVIFISRADKELINLKEKYGCISEYFILCEQYLFTLSKYILKNRNLSEVLLQILPDRYKI